MLEGLAPKEKEALCFLMKKAATELDANDIRILNEALADARFSNNGLRDALADRGFVVSHGVVNNHRNGTCACAR